VLGAGVIATHSYAFGGGDVEGEALAAALAYEASRPSRLRCPPRVKVFGSLARDGQVLGFLSDDTLTRLYKGVVVASNRMLTGSDASHAHSLQSFGIPIGQVMLVVIWTPRALVPPSSPA
jgi:hypothetical protein